MDESNIMAKMRCTDNRGFNPKRTVIPEAVPLRTTLSVESQNVVVDYTVLTTSLLHLVSIWVPVIARINGLVERPVERDTNA